ncbi:MAG TPA: DUF1552 domain-containing protein [Planctomycetota bacterium]
MTKQLSRRTVLRGMGVALGLPALESMRVFANDGSPKPPVRMAFCFWPNGVNTKMWFPKDVGADWAITPSLEPLAPFKKDFQVLTGLAQTRARANGDGAGDHARSAATFLTGRQARKTDGKDIRAGVSVDQVAAEKLAGQTRLASLEIGCDKGAMAGNCDSGYSCAYSSTISWKAEAMPLPKEVNPRQIFGRLFGDPGSLAAERDRARQAMYRKSVLDLVRDDAAGLSKELGTSDRRKVDEYLESVRSIEKQIQASERKDAPKLPADVEVPADGIPSDFPSYMRLLSDLLVLAFQTDATRIATYVFANEGSNRTFPWIDVREGHHSLSHHGGNPDKLAQIAKIDRFYAEMFAHLLGKLKAVKEGDGTLLDHSMIVFGAAIGDGNRHNHDELPVILAGGGGGTLKPGRHVKHPFETPMCNLFLSMMDRMGVKEESFGDSTGRLSDL